MKLQSYPYLRRARGIASVVISLVVGLSATAAYAVVGADTVPFEEEGATTVVGSRALFGVLAEAESGPQCSSGVDVNISGLLGNEAEVSIDVNPTDPDNLVVVGHIEGFDTMNTFYTLDGGQTWSLVALGNADDGLTSGFRFDPTLAFDDLGNLYVGYGVRHFIGSARQETVVVCKSTDGGQTYPQCTQVHTQPTVVFPDASVLAGNDKWHLATGPDPDTPAQHNVYIAWTNNAFEAVGDPPVNQLDQRIVLSVSTDGGATFSVPTVVADDAVSGQDRGLFADPAVAADGTLYVSWHDFGEDRIYVDVSTDGGATFGADVLVTSLSFDGLFDPIPAQPDRQITPGPTLDVDRSGGANHGRLYLIYTDFAAPATNDTDIFLRTSDTLGASWSAALRVNDDAGTNSQFLPWVDVDQTTGTVHAVWYDARNDPGNQQVETFIAASNDGGATFTINLPLSDGVSDQSTNNPSRWGNNFLEYIGVAGLDCAAVAVWADNSLDPADLDYFVDRFVPSFCGLPPTADAGPDQTVECDGGLAANVTLNGTGSTDPDGDIVTYEWYEGGTLLGAGANLGVSLGLGAHEITLRTLDALELLSCDAVTVEVVDTTPPSLTPPPAVVAECAGPGGTPVNLGTPIVSDVCDPGAIVSNDAPPTFPLGVTLVTWSAVDSSGNVAMAVQQVTIVDTTPPEISVSVSPDTLWPPNHKLVEIAPTVIAADTCDPDPTVTLLNITTSEGDETLTFDPAFDAVHGDGHTLDDIQVVDGQILLRAERSGVGDGREYTITYQATDDSGNTATASATVTVPHSL